MSVGVGKHLLAGNKVKNQESTSVLHYSIKFECKIYNAWYVHASTEDNKYTDNLKAITDVNNEGKQLR